MQINKRLFGTPLGGEVRKKLEDRQKVAGTTEFGDSITANASIPSHLLFTQSTNL